METSEQVSIRGKLQISRDTPEAWKDGAGRRTFIAYRDLGIHDATEGQLNIQASYISHGSKAPQTGWHYHTCDFQVVYVLEGWVDMQFAEGETVRLNAGDCINIPPGQPQNEIAISDNFRCLEIRAPLEIGTVPCEPPARS